MVKSEIAIVFFDGVCTLCNRSVQFILTHEKAPLLSFATLQSGLFAQLCPDLSNTFAQIPQGVVLYRHGSTHVGADAALLIVPYLRWYWQWLRLAWVLPRPLRNAAYGYVARNRYQWFGRQESCWMPTPKLRNRFV